MKTVTVATKLTEKMTEIIDEMVEEGIYTSRSDALRDAARILIFYQKDAMGKRKSPLVSKKEKSTAWKNYAKKRGFKL